jgi:hypothetical protein
MKNFHYSFNLTTESTERLEGILHLKIPIISQDSSEDFSYRSGKIELGNKSVELVLVHSTASANLVYLYRAKLNQQFINLLDLNQKVEVGDELVLPGQLLLGAARTKVMGEGTKDIVRTPLLTKIFHENPPDKIAVFPIFREGIRYQVVEALYAVYANYYNEIMIDAHHISDKTIPGYNRRVGSVKFFDRDVTDEQMDKVNIAVVADSISGGVVLLGVLEELQKRCPNLSQVEVIAQFATLRGLARLAAYTSPQLSIRVHTFETILNSLEPNYYYAAHFREPEMHILPSLEKEYQDWWGKDKNGKKIANSLCAGFGWSFVYFTPEKQIQVIDHHLQSKHSMTLPDVISHNIRH